jgi:hypothetical protein
VNQGDWHRVADMVRSIAARSSTARSTWGPGGGEFGALGGEDVEHGLGLSLVGSGSQA